MDLHRKVSRFVIWLKEKNNGLVLQIKEKSMPQAIFFIANFQRKISIKEQKSPIPII